MNFYKFFRDKLLNFISTNRTFINLVGIPLVIFTVFLVKNTNDVDLNWGDTKNWWGDWGDPILGLATFLVAVVIWLTNTAKDWEERLDKLLTVSYIDLNTNREVIRCEDAFLAHEGDIRNWGQTLGRQTIGKNKEGYLISFDFSNSIKMDTPKLEERGGTYYKHYNAIFFLTALPPKEDLANGKDLRLGKFVWKAGAEKSQFILDKTQPA